MRAVLILVIVIAISACTKEPVEVPSFKLAKTAKHLMKDPEAQPAIAENDDLYGRLAESRTTLSARNAQVRGLQRYIRLIHKRPKGAPS